MGTRKRRISEATVTVVTSEFEMLRLLTEARNEGLRPILVVDAFSRCASERRRAELNAERLGQKPDLESAKYCAIIALERAEHFGFSRKYIKALLPESLRDVIFGKPAVARRSAVPGLLS